MKATNQRIIVFDTETTGMNMTGPHYEGHRIIEIGAVEIINRKLTGKTFHVYIKPDRPIDPEAIDVHGITDEFLIGKPSYADIHQEFIDFIDGAELVAHNASFDIGFMDYEFQLMGSDLKKTEDICKVTDTLEMAKRLFPGKRNNLDILCSRYGIDNSHRTLHGALLDAEILADVYLMMTGGQTSLKLSGDDEGDSEKEFAIKRLVAERKELKVICASADELVSHEERLDLIGKKTDVLWRL